MLFVKKTLKKYTFKYFQKQKIGINKEICIHQCKTLCNTLTINFFVGVKLLTRVQNSFQEMKKVNNLGKVIIKIYSKKIKNSNKKLL